MAESLEEKLKTKIMHTNSKDHSKSSTSSLIVSITFCLKNGSEIYKTAYVKQGEFENFKQSMIKQVSNEENRWFYFLSDDNPHSSSLIRISDISCMDIIELQPEPSIEEREDEGYRTPHYYGNKPI